MSESITCMRLPPNHYRGSKRTYEMVRKQIFQRFGPEAAKAYIPSQSARPFQEWVRLGFKVKPGEKGLKSLIFVEKKNEKGEVIKRVPKLIYVFHEQSVTPINQS